MEERFIISNLLDIYESLLTKKQNEIMNLYYNEDFSLLEISEHTQTSRQAVFDLIKRCNKLLLKYETSLKIYEKKQFRKEIKENILLDLNSILIKNIDEDSKKKLNEILVKLNEMN